MIDGEIKLPRNSKQMLNTMFPKLRHLTLNAVDVPDPSIFNIKFPHLKHLKIVYPKFPLNEPSQAIVNLFRMNSQIKNVELVCCSPKYHDLAIDYLADVESFQATYFPTHVTKPKSKIVRFNI